MSPTRFTPGPWEVFDQTDEYEECWAVGMGSYLEDPNNYATADFWFCESADKKAEANAHLIAAAPELYAALHAMCSHWDSLLNNMDSGEEFNARIAAGAALAKARGGES